MLLRRTGFTFGGEEETGSRPDGVGRNGGHKARSRTIITFTSAGRKMRLVI